MSEVTKPTVLRLDRGGLIKAVSENTFEGYLVRYGEQSDRDLDLEWFSPNSYFMLKAGYPVKGAPINYQHGMEHKFGNVGIGLFDFVDQDDIGLFVNGQLQNKERYEDMLRELGRVKGIKLLDRDIRHKAEIAHKAVSQLVTSVPLRQSMGADIATFRVNEDTGHIDQCGIVHGALTPTPSDNKNPLVRFKSALDYVYDLQDTSTTFSFPVGLNESGIVSSTKTSSIGEGVVVNVYAGATPDPAKAVTPNREVAPESARQTSVPDQIQPRQTKGKVMKVNERVTRLLKMTEEEDELLRSELASALHGVLDKIGMKPDDEEMEEYVEEMEDNLEKQDAEVEGVVEEAAVAVAEDLGEEVAADVPITQDIVEQVVEENLEAILPEEVKSALRKYAARKAKADQRRKSKRERYGERALSGVKAGTPTRSKKSEIGGFGQKAWSHVGKADRPSVASMVKSIVAREYKAQNPYIGNLGGYLLGQEVAQNILGPLRAEVIMFDAGIKQTTVNNTGVYTVPKMTTAPTAYRPGINTAITDSNAEFDTITAFLRPIAAQCIIPMQLLRTAEINDLDSRITDELVKSIRLQIDKEILLGEGTVVNGSGAEIKGILSVLEEDATLSGTNIVTLNTNGRPPNYTDLIDAETQISNNNVTLMDNSSGWVMHTRTRGTFRSLTTTTGEPLLFDNYGQKSYQELIGYKVHPTTQVPINITTGSSDDTSYIFFGEYSYGEYVMANDIEIIVDEMTLADKLQVRIIAYTFSDFIVHYPEAFYVMKGVRAS